MSGSIPLWVHYLPASTGIDVIPLPYVHVPSEVCSQITLPVVFTPILSGPSSRHPWYKLQLPIFPPQGSFTGKSSGDCLTIFLLWHPLFITSNRGSLAWGGAGTPVPCMMAAHTQVNANL